MVFSFLFICFLISFFFSIPIYLPISYSPHILSNCFRACFISPFSSYQILVLFLYYLLLFSPCFNLLSIFVPRNSKSSSACVILISVFIGILYISFSLMINQYIDFPLNYPYKSKLVFIHPSKIILLLNRIRGQREVNASGMYECMNV